MTRHSSSSLTCLSAALALAAVSADPFTGTWFSGDGPGDAQEWLETLEVARAQLSPNPTLMDVSMLYTTAWNGLVEGPTWDAWWTQNSYGYTLTSLPFTAEPVRSFIRNANDMWFTWEGNGTIVGLDSPLPAPDGCLCDAAMPTGAYYKQGDGIVDIHDWALEETLSGVIMQAEMVLEDRDVVAAAYYLPLFNRTLNLIESRRDAETNLFYSGDASNLLAPSYGAYLLPNGTRVPAFLTGMSVSYIAALDRVIEIENIVGGPIWSQMAALHMARRESALAGLPTLLAPSGDYFVKWMDPDENKTLHGVLGQSQHGYIEAVCNHDAIALGVSERVQEGLSESIMARLVGDTVPPNPVTGGPGLRPYSLVTTNAGTLDDMEESDDSWLWMYGTWVNGGEWATCEARMMMAYFRTGRASFALDSMRALMGFARAFRMDSPLVEWGSAPYQPNEPINIVVDMYAIPTALIRGLWDPVYFADSLVFSPHLPGNLTQISTLFPFLWGGHWLYLSANGNGTLPLASVTVNGTQWPANLVTATNATLLWSLMPSTPGSNITIVFNYPANQQSSTSSSSSSSAAGGALKEEATSTSPSSSASTTLHPSTQATLARLYRSLMPSDSILWLEADKLTLSDGAAVSVWPDSSNGGAGTSTATQSNTTSQPIYQAKGMNGYPAVSFNGTSDFLQGNITLPLSFTVIGVFLDRGETNECCTGIFFGVQGCGGMGTKVGTSPGTTVIMIDWSGSSDAGADDVTNRQVVGSVLYNSSGGYSWADGCGESIATGIAPLSSSTSFMVGSRGNALGRYFNGLLSELLVFPRALNETERETVEAYLAAKWPLPSGQHPLSCLPAPPNCTIPAPLLNISARIDAFVSAMRVGGFADSKYELAHALLALESLSVWGNRCAGLNNGTITPLPARASEAAADALYVSSASNLATGLAATLNGYAGSTDPTKSKIYAIWQSTA